MPDVYGIPRAAPVTGTLLKTTFPTSDQSLTTSQTLLAVPMSRLQSADTLVVELAAQFTFGGANPSVGYVLAWNGQLLCKHINTRAAAGGPFPEMLKMVVATSGLPGTVGSRMAFWGNVGATADTMINSGRTVTANVNTPGLLALTLTWTNPAGHTLSIAYATAYIRSGD